MVSTFTTNKALEKPGNGDYVDTWNVPVNSDLDVIDQALGTVTSVNLAGGNVVLADTQYRSMGLTFTGALPAARTVTIPSGVGGSWIVTNNTTDASGGPWSVTVLSGGGGTSVALVRSKSSIIYSDGTNITEVNINAPVGTGSVTSVAVSGGTTGLTTSGGPVTTSGTITINGTLIPANGGTGITSYTVGDIPYASASGTLSPLASVATGNVLLSGGIAGAPSYGKVGLTTHVSGTLPVANGGTGITSPGTTGNVLTSNGTAWVSQSFLPSGTAMLFVQTTAPTGWTKSTTHDNKALRVVSGAASSGGTTAFTSVFTSRTITTSNMPSHSHGVNDPGHAHTLRYSFAGGDSGSGNYFAGQGGTAGIFSTGGFDRTASQSVVSAATGISIQNAGSGTPMDFAVQYVDVIIATKD